VARFILIHGAWHGGWCWWRVAERLRALGHEVETPDLPSHGSDETSPDGVTLDTYVDSISALVDEADAPPILVGHSMGGLVVSQLAEQRPDEIASTVYLAAILPSPGEESLEPVASAELRASLRPSADGTVIEFAPEGARDVFYARCSDEDIAFAIERLCPQSASVLSTAPELSRQRFGRVPSAYIECLEDRALPVEGQREMHTRAGCRRVFSIGTDHSPFFSRPDDLVEILHEIAS
jgi:pimeloyl-ACP methyl ester carboxylesterase